MKRKRRRLGGCDPGGTGDVGISQEPESSGVEQELQETVPKVVVLS